MPDLRYHLINAAGFGMALPREARPTYLQPRRPKVNLQRAYKSTQYRRLDDGLGSLEALRLTWTHKASSETALSQYLQQWRAHCATPGWLTRADRSVMTVQAAVIDAEALQNGPSHVATVTLDVYGTTGIITDQQTGLEVFF